MSVVASTFPGVHHHPWRAFRRLIDWTLHWTDLPEGTLGRVDWATKTVTLTTGMTQAERRSTICHEIVHLERGPAIRGYGAREELEVSKEAARRLLPDIRAVGEALAWSLDLGVAADELWVDRGTLRVRLEHLHPAERAYLKRRLADDDQHEDNEETA